MRFGPGADISYDTATPLTDAADGDPGSFQAGEGNLITVNWGDAAAGQTGAVFFRVTVNTGLSAGVAVSNRAVVNYESPQGSPASAYNSTPGIFTVATQGSPVLAIGNNAGAGESGGKVSYPITVTNGGNATDVLDITTLSTGGFPNQIWVDANGDGIASNDGDYLLTDTDGDGKPDTGNLVAGGTMKIIVVVNIPPGTADGTVDVTTVTATSSNDPAIAASGTLSTTTRTPVVTIAKSVSPTGSQPPGQVLTYAAVVTNGGQGVATNVVFNDPVPANTTYVPSSVTVNGAGRTDAADGDNVVVTNNNVVVNIGTLGPGGTVTIRFSVTIN